MTKINHISMCVCLGQVWEVPCSKWAPLDSYVETYPQGDGMRRWEFQEISSWKQGLPEWDQRSYQRDPTQFPCAPTTDDTTEVCSLEEGPA